jgi:hypothetical protein
LNWQEMDAAPKDGTQILVARDNGCGWEYFTVWWSGGGRYADYPWKSDHNAYPADRFDYWSAITPPKES